MPSKTSKQGRPYDVDGKALIWHPEPWDDYPLPDVRLPLRIKLGELLKLGETNVLSSNEQMYGLVNVLTHGVQEATCYEMDVNDFQDMIQTWMTEYSLVSGTNLGKPSASSPSSPSTEAPSNTTGEPASTVE